MTGLSHAMASWLVAQGAGEELRDRRLVGWLGIAPDVDVLAYAAGAVAGGGLDAGMVWHAQVHHRYTHGLGMLLAALLITLLWSRNKLRTAVLAQVAVALHLLGDLAASGPDWPVYPWWPLSDRAWSVSWSVPVYAWPNLALGFVLLAAALLYARRSGRTPLELVSRKMDRELSRHLSAGG